MNRFYRVALLVLIALASFATAQAKVVDRSEALETATSFPRSHSRLAVLSASNVKEVWNSNQLSAAGVATGIKAVEGDLIANDAIYDLSGRKVSKAVKGGVYIINGRKVLVK